MARAIWTGSISFGLLNVPVKLYSATARRQISFRELRASDGSRIRHKRVAEADGEEVPYEEIVKGYDLGGEQYVVLEKGELEALDPAKTHEIKAEDFVNEAEIDAIYFDQPYYLAPQKGAERAYALLVRAMRETGRVAIARFVMRSRERLTAIRPLGDALVIETMRFADEVLSPGEVAELLPGDDVEVDEREVKMAKQLIGSLEADFDAGRYEDEYREALTALIEKKARGEEIVSADTERPKPTPTPDLMAVLRESIDAVKAEDSGGKAKKAKTPARTTKSRAHKPAKKRSSAKSKK